MANSRVLVVLFGAFMVLTKADTILRLKRGKYVDQVSRVRNSTLLWILKSNLIVLLHYFNLIFSSSICSQTTHCQTSIWEMSWLYLHPWTRPSMRQATRGPKTKIWSSTIWVSIAFVEIVTSNTQIKARGPPIKVTSWNMFINISVNVIVNLGDSSTYNNEVTRISSMLPGSPPLWMTKHENEFYVNGARVIMRNLQAGQFT